MEKKAKTIIFTEKYTLISNLLDALMCVHFLRNIETYSMLKSKLIYNYFLNIYIVTNF